VTGLTASTDFPIGSVGTHFQSTNNAATLCGTSTNPPATAAFVDALDTTQAGLAQIVYGTYFGGCGLKLSGGGGSVGFGDAPTDIHVKGDKIYIAGTTTGGIIAGSFPLSANVLPCGPEVVGTATPFATPNPPATESKLQQRTCYRRHRRAGKDSADGIRNRTGYGAGDRGQPADILGAAGRVGTDGCRGRRHAGFERPYRGGGIHVLE
jgi:hypothetical protein